jgi:hypothetical protein
MQAVLTDIPAPQANSLPALSVVVDAVSDGCVTDEAIAKAIGYSDRQGAYYPHAAAELGLIREVFNTRPREWQLTESGARFVGSAADERVTFLVDLLCESRWLLAYVDSEKQAQILLEEMGYNDETTSRRLACIGSWADFVFNQNPAEQAAVIAASMTGVRKRIPGALAGQRRGSSLIEVNRCSSCFMQIPTEAVCCDYCIV